MNEISQEAHNENKSIGFVPTMGYLHEGHLSLIEKARRENDFLVISIYVNPTQFGPDEDFDRYPRDIKRDKKLAGKGKVDVVFAPEDKAMYPGSFQTYINNEGMLSKGLCGIMRPGHFRGVCTVVDKLFNIIEPDTTYFGQKDYQQVLILKQMVRDLNKNIEIKILPIVREEDGLAVSSRNKYLSPKERKKATILYESLKAAEDMIKSDIKDVRSIKKAMVKRIKDKNATKIDYIKIVDSETLEKVDRINKKVLVALAVWIGKNRLIDNILVEP